LKKNQQGCFGLVALFATTSVANLEIFNRFVHNSTRNAAFLGKFALANSHSLHKMNKLLFSLIAILFSSQALLAQTTAVPEKKRPRGQEGARQNPQEIRCL
jgi:hypothetical protein